MVFRFLRSGLVTCTLLAQGPASPSRVLTLPDCLRLAREAQSSVTIARRQAEIARLGVRQARAGFLPQSRLGNSFIYNSPLLYDRSVFSFIPLNAIREYASLFTVGMELDSSGKLRAELSRAHAEREAAEAEVRLSERDLKRAVTGAYLRVLLARHVARATRQSLEEARSFERRVQLLQENEEASRADVVKASASTALLEQALEQAELEAKLAEQELASFWTTDVNQTLELEDLLEQTAPPPEEPTPGKPFLKRPELLLLDAQRRAALADSRRARAELLPQLSLTFQYGLDASRVRWLDRGYAAFVNLNVPVFDWFKAASASRQARLRARQAEAQRVIAERTFAREYENALARVRQLYRQIALTETQVRLGEENLRLSRLRYEGGEGSALDVVSAQAQLAQARTNYYTALSNYWNARADLEVASAP